jgi:tRNA threonylcarbamoyladenosine biosynthesis protein TsaE
LSARSDEFVRLSHSPTETLAIGRTIGAALRPGTVIGLVGRLGAGKTLLVKGIAAGNGLADDGAVTSPTFTLVQEYDGKIHLYHIDVYRLKGPEDLVALGFDEMCAAGGAVIVEWADRAAGVLPEDTLWIEIESTDEEARRLTIRPAGEAAWACASAIRA